MKFVIANIDMAKKAAKSLRREMGKAGHDVPLHEAQRLLAAMYGYADWHALEQSAGKGTPSPADRSLSLAQVDARRGKQVAVLEQAGIEWTVAELILAKVQPTGPRLPVQVQAKGPGRQTEMESDKVGPGPIHPGAVVPAAFDYKARLEFYQTVLSLGAGANNLRQCYDLMEKVYSRRSDKASEVATVILRTLKAIHTHVADPFYGVTEGDGRGLGEVMQDIGVELSVVEDGILMAMKEGSLEPNRGFRSLVEGVTLMHSLENQYRQGADITMTVSGTPQSLSKVPQSFA